MSWLLAVVLALYLGLNVLASFRVLHSSVASRTQRLFQLAVVWILPVLGAVTLLAFLSSEREGQATLDRTAFEDKVDAAGQSVDASQGSINTCGLGSDSAGDGGGD